MTSFDRSAAPARLAKGAPMRIPGLLIGRLGVDQGTSGHGLGTALVLHLLCKAMEINAMAACRAVIVDALNPQAFRWWQRFGFVPFDPNGESDLDLYLLTGDIERTLAAAGEKPG